MSTRSIKLYYVLVDLDVDRETAAEALDPILTKDEALQVLATKDDLGRESIDHLPWRMRAAVIYKWLKQYNHIRLHQVRT